MEQSELRDAVLAARSVAPVPTVVVPETQTQANLNERVVQIKAASGMQPTFTPGKKVAVLGFTDSWKAAPFSDPSWEIWGLNELYMMIPRWTRWFELHTRSVYEADKNRTNDHIYALRAMTCPVYMHQHYDDIPMSVAYPLNEIARAFPSPAEGSRPYLTNSISYMLALAIYENFQEIMIAGVDMAHDTEYGTQRPSCEYYIGIAQGRGVKVTMPPECELLKTDFLYGYEQEVLERWNVRMAARETDLSNKINTLDQQIAQAMEARAQYRGALQDTQHLRKNWKGIVATT